MNKQWRIYSMMPIVAILCMAVCLTGCEPLRKKFVRQKKRDQIESKGFEPVLEPQEYPALKDNPTENYKERYALLKAWYKDAWEVLEKKADDKRQKYVLEQMYVQLSQMQALIISTEQARFGQLIDLLKYYNDSLSKPVHMRNISRIQSDLRAFDRLLRQQWKVEKAEPFLVKQS